MRRSARVKLGLVTGVAAALLAGCSDDIEGIPPQAQVCANEEGVIVPDEHCAPKPQANTSTSDNVRGHGSGPIFVHGGYGYPYSWRYYPPDMGSTAVGTRVPPVATKMPSANLIPQRPNVPGFSGFKSGGFGKSGGVSSGFSSSGRGGGFSGGMSAGS
jgi:uncharacterized membrane protein YgcG